ncbi:hypothetical protein E6R18_18900 [Streptomyces sp. A1277]|uniref:MFS transporter n=1 Tax=Streptomyces sp. A1277 TaxID=2563103 RepID=UPI0010A22F10|nr:MFS transporter [Streptomyces sp. A1277]THA30854.1 hypothetical protein E6R18_18900 [Streptomyces sp. A1277]
MAGHWIEHRDPEDETFWRQGGERIVRRNLWFSVLSEHIGFSVWTLWSVMVLFMGPEYGVDPAGQPFLISTATLVGALARAPYTSAVARFGGRNWTVFSALTLLVPTLAALVVMKPGTSYAAFLAVSALTGLGNGSTYKMIPGIFHAQALAQGLRGEEAAARGRLSGAAMGLIGAVGALGGLAVNPAFRQSFQTSGAGTAAFWSFLAFYAVCSALTWAVYLRPAATAPAKPQLSHAEV